MREQKCLNGECRTSGITLFMGKLFKKKNMVNNIKQSESDYGMSIVLRNVEFTSELVFQRNFSRVRIHIDVNGLRHYTKRLKEFSCKMKRERAREHMHERVSNRAVVGEESLSECVCVYCPKKDLSTFIF